MMGRKIDNNRFLYLDIFKALAVFLVILGHAPGCNLSVKQIIYSFHMPAFFAAYGIAYDADKHSRSGFINCNFMINKTIRLLLPYTFWGIIYLHLNVNIKTLAYLLYGNQRSLIMAESLSSLWFLPCMFLSVCLFEFLAGLQVLLSPIKMLAAVVILVSINLALPLVKLGYPWSFNTMFLAVSFIISGYFVKKYFLTLLSDNYIVLGISTAFSILLLLMLYRLNLKNINLRNVDMASNTVGNIFLYYSCALCGIIFLLGLSIILSRYVYIYIIYIAFMGRHTMTIFLLHKPLVIYLSQVLKNHYFVASLITVCFICALLYNLNYLRTSIDLLLRGKRK